MKLTGEQLAELIAKGVNSALEKRFGAAPATPAAGGATPPAPETKAADGAIVKTDTPGAVIAAAAGTITKVEVVERNTEKGLRGALFVKALAAARGNRQEAIAYAKDQYKHYGETGAEIEKALATAPTSAGGAIIPPQYSAEIIGLLYNRTAVRRLGATVIPMQYGNLTYPKLLSSAAAAYIGENTDQNASQQTFGTVSLSWKKLRAMVPTSNDLLRFSTPAADTIIREDLTASFQVAEDITFLRGTGSATAPTGLRYLVPDGTGTWTFTQLLDLAATVDATTVRAELYKMLAKLAAANIPMIRPGWVLSIRTSYFLKGLQTSVGVPVFPEMTGANPNLLGVPYVETAQVPDNLGTGGNETEIYLGDWFDALIGESTELTIDASAEAAYKDSGGTLVSAFSQDQTVLRAIARHDFNIRRDKSFVIGLKATWGAPAA